MRRDETHLLYNSYFGPEGHADVHDLGVIILEELVVEITPATLPTEGFLDAMKTEGTLRFGAVLGRDENVPSPRGETVTRTNNEAANLRGSHRSTRPTTERRLLCRDDDGVLFWGCWSEVDVPDRKSASQRSTLGTPLLACHPGRDIPTRLLPWIAIPTNRSLSHGSEREVSEMDKQ